VTKQIDKRATGIVYSMAKRTQRSTLIPHASRHETEHGVLPPDHPSIPHEFSESGVDLVLNATERRVVPFHDSTPCHFAALPPGHGTQNKSRSKKVSLASNYLPDFFITCGGGVTTQRSPSGEERRRSLGSTPRPPFGFRDYDLPRKCVVAIASLRAIPLGAEGVAIRQGRRAPACRREERSDVAIRASFFPAEQ